MQNSHKIRKERSLEEQMARTRLPGDVFIEEEINNRILKNFPEGIPFIGEQYSKSREHTLEFGKDLRDYLQGKKGSPSLCANDYVFDIKKGETFDRNSPEYQRSFAICNETIDAFLQHRKEDTQKFMSLAEEEKLPMVTHSFLVAHRLKHLAIPKGYYREVLRASMLLHDVKEDTKKNVKKILEKAVKAHPFEKRELNKKFTSDVIAVTGLLTRRETFYVRDIQHILEGKNSNNTKTSLERILLAAIVKQEDRHVNTRSLEPFDIQKRAKEIMKSLWVADYLGKELLQKYSDKKKIPAGEGPKSIRMLLSTLRVAIYDNFRSIYGALKAETLKAEDNLKRQKNGWLLAKRIQHSVYNHIKDGGLQKLSQPGDKDGISNFYSLNGLILRFFSTLYPTEETIKRAYKNLGGTPSRTNQYLKKHKRRILANTPSIMQPAVYRQRLGVSPNKDVYDTIMGWQEELKNELKKPMEAYSLLFGLYKVVQHHLDLDEGGEKYHLLRPVR